MNKFKIGDKKFNLDDINMIAYNATVFNNPDGPDFFKYISVFTTKNKNAPYNYYLVNTNTPGKDFTITNELKSVYERLKAENKTNFAFIDNILILNLDKFKKVKCSYNKRENMYDVDIYCGNTIFNHQEYYKDYAFELTDSIKDAKKKYDLEKENENSL